MTSDAPAADGPSPRRRRRLPPFTEVLVALVAVALVQAFFIKPFGVPSQSMEETLHIGDRIIVNRLDHSIAHGDVVVFGHGTTWQSARLPTDPNLFKRTVRAVGDLTGIGPSNTAYTVKRVIGLPGDTVACCSADGRVLRDGEPLDEPYVFEDLPFTPGVIDCGSTPRSTRCFPKITVPSRRYLVMGDHRSQSADSVIGCRGATEGPECVNLVPEGRVIGPVVLRFWPLTDIGQLAR